MNIRKENGDRTKKVSFNLGFQGGYDFTSHWGVFMEAVLNGMDKFYSNSGFPLSLGCDLSIGFRYRFSKHCYEKPSQQAENNCDKQFNQLSKEVDRLNDEINKLRKQLEEERLNTNGRTVMLAPVKEQASIDIFFDKFSSFISEEQRQKIDAVGEWMKSNSLKIRIVAFSDDLSDKEADEKLRNSRVEAIQTLLTENYGINKERITVLRVEDLGYENQTGCNAKIHLLNKIE